MKAITSQSCAGREVVSGEVGKRREGARQGVLAAHVGSSGFGAAVNYALLFPLHLNFFKNYF